MYGRVSNHWITLHEIRLHPAPRGRRVGARVPARLRRPPGP